MKRLSLRMTGFALAVFPVAMWACSDDALQEPLTREQLLDPYACKDCHPTHFKQWSGSMHAYAAEDPMFLAMNKRGQRETKGKLGDLCVKCHAPMAVREGLTTDGLNLDEIPRPLKGITCVFCHSVTDVTADHNAALDITLDGVMRGGLTQPLKTGAHGSKYSLLHDGGHLDSSKMCGACHDIKLENDVHLERTFKEWKGTLFSQSTFGQQSSCGSCHMHKAFGKAAEVPGAEVRRLHSHEFPGVDVAITDFPERDVQRQHVQQDLDPTVIAQLCVEITETTQTRVEVMLQNVAAGHSFPSGASLDRRAWVELIAKKGGKVLHQSGVVADDEPVAESKDSDLWLLRDQGFDAKYNEVHMFWEIEKTASQVLPGPPAGVEAGSEEAETRRIRTYMLPAKPDAISMRLRMRPMGLEVLASLVKSGDLAKKHVAAMPTFDLKGTMLEWTAKGAKEKITPTGRKALCVPKLLVEGADDPLAGADAFKPPMARKTKKGQATVTLEAATPAPPAEGNNIWTVSVKGKDGKALNGLSIVAGTWMPAHRHGSPIIASSKEIGDGRYTVSPIELFMPGLWEITLGLTGNGVDDKVVYRFWLPE